MCRQRDKQKPRFESLRIKQKLVASDRAHQAACTNAANLRCIPTWSCRVAADDRLTDVGGVTTRPPSALVGVRIPPHTSPELSCGRSMKRRSSVVNQYRVWRLLGCLVQPHIRRTNAELSCILFGSVSYLPSGGW